MLLAVIIASTLAAANDPATQDKAARVAQVEAALPWFWSPASEGLSDIPYTYVQRLTRRIVTRDSKEVPATPGGNPLSQWRELQLERIPLEWGSLMKCLTHDGKAPCPIEWNQELERQTKQLDALTSEDRAKVDASRESRRRRRRKFWADFPEALAFESDGENRIRFSPLPKSANGMLSAISGRLTFDAITERVVRFEFDLSKDVDEPLMRLPKGTHFEMELSKTSDGNYVPAKMQVRQSRGRAGETEERTIVFSGFKRFGSESEIRFSDPPQ